MRLIVSGFCKLCDDGVHKRLVSRTSGLCLHHYQFVKKKEAFEKRKEKKGIAKITVKQKEIDKQDEAFYRQIWKERKHVSEVSGIELGDKMSRWFMSHILTKKNYPHYRHNPENILLMSKQEHHTWEFGIPEGENWERVKALQQKLREEYNQRERSGEWLLS